VWDDLFNRPVCSFIQSRNKRELTTRATFPYTQLLIDLNQTKQHWYNGTVPRA